MIIPGLLQTADYARTLDRTYFQNDTDSELDRRVEVRMRRQAVVLRNRKPANAFVVLHEAAIRTRVGDRRIMPAQLRHLAHLAAGHVGVRDSKHPSGPALVFAPVDWDVFEAAVRSGAFDS
ncbi:Scr1 family TA system antitoxin-like transcriptional regulator [Nocardia sp. NPDC006630]|uniref:DUF397 domain-containing protein n=1 Tax=Nocardia sp. NPDC006630 TaxID=3157181 RepID=UPI0033A84D18